MYPAHFAACSASRGYGEAWPASCSSLSAAWLLSRAVLESACCVFFFGVDVLENRVVSSSDKTRHDRQIGRFGE